MSPVDLQFRAKMHNDGQARRKRCGMAAVAAPKICREREKGKRREERKRKEEKEKPRRKGKKGRGEQETEKDVLGLWF